MAKRYLYVMTGGGADGLVCHTAAIAELERAGFRPSAIHGTSAGAVIGSLYAAGFSPDEIAKRITSLESRDVLDWRSELTLAARMLRQGKGLLGFCPGRAFYDQCKEWLQERGASTFGDLEIPFACETCNISWQREERFSTKKTPRAEVASAVRASGGIPVLFDAWKIGPYYYTDGGVLNNVPVDEANEEWAGDVDELILITSLGDLVGNPHPFNPEERWAFIRVIEMNVRAAVNEYSFDNLKGDIPLRILAIRGTNASLSDPELWAEWYQLARSYAEAKIRMFDPP